MAFRLSQKADRDLFDIYLKGVEQFGILQADTYAAGLTEAFHFLAEFPRAARERTELSPPMRILRYKSHLIFYIIDDEDVFIVRIRHGHEDWLN